MKKYVFDFIFSVCKKKLGEMFYHRTRLCTLPYVTHLSASNYRPQFHANKIEAYLQARLDNGLIFEGFQWQITEYCDHSGINP